MKKCNQCEEEKKLTEFYKDINGKFGYRGSCKLCKKKYYQKIEVKEKVKERNASLSYIEIQKRRTSTEEFKKNRRIKQQTDDFKEKTNARKRERLSIDINYKLRENLRSRLNKAIKNDQKIGSAVSDLGCSIEELKRHLEVQFEPGMTWDNWSRVGWHIDHIKALANFDLINREELLKACHYSNLQPMWAKDNLSKGSKK